MYPAYFHGLSQWMMAAGFIGQHFIQQPVVFHSVHMLSPLHLVILYFFHWLTLAVAASSLLM
jgi:hypothetical protein